MVVSGEAVSGVTVSRVTVCWGDGFLFDGQVVYAGKVGRAAMGLLAVVAILP